MWVYIYIYIYTYTYNGILFSHKNEWNSAICNNMDLESILLNEVSQKEGDKYHMISLVYGV